MFKVLDEVCTPTKGSKYSACIDLYAREDIVIGAGQRAMIPLGICLEYSKFPVYIKNSMDSHYIQVEPRSSIRKAGLNSTGTGIIDMDYSGEIMLILEYPFNHQHTMNTIGMLNYQNEKTHFFKGINEDFNDELIAFLGEEYLELKAPFPHFFKIKKGDKIAQMMLCEHKSHFFGIETDDIRNGGFGSTGK